MDGSSLHKTAVQPTLHSFRYFATAASKAAVSVPALTENGQHRSLTATPHWPAELAEHFRSAPLMDSI
jgi:hypothetical protein